MAKNQFYQIIENIYPVKFDKSVKIYIMIVFI